MMADEIIVLGKESTEINIRKESDFHVDLQKDGLAGSSYGSILERGSHHDLLRLGGTYARMWEAQTNISPEIIKSTKSDIDIIDI